MESETHEDKVEEEDEYRENVHLTVPQNTLTRTISLNDTKTLLRCRKQADMLGTSNSETDLRRYSLSPLFIRRSASVNECSSELSSGALTVRVNLSDDEVFEFPHTRSPMSLKVMFA